MPTFKVTIEALAPAMKSIEIEADNADQAAEKAEESGHRFSWIPWTLSGKPDRTETITVIEVEDA